MNKKSNDKMLKAMREIVDICESIVSDIPECEINKKEAKDQIKELKTKLAK